MTDPPSHQPPDRDDYRDDLDETVTGPERRALLNLALRLAKERPLPRAGARSEIRSQLLGGGKREEAQLSPLRLRALVFGYAAAGAVMLGVAAIGLAGAGPFAA
jgi:hypothetical protein